MDTFVEVLPDLRIDTLVHLPDGTQARRTDYSGTVWLEGRPEVSGSGLRRSPRAPRGIRSNVFSVPFFVPDSLAYVRANLGAAQLSCSAALRAAGDVGAVADATATFVDDPSTTPTWIHVHVTGQIGWPAAIVYRIIAVTPPDAVR